MKKLFPIPLMLMLAATGCVRETDEGCYTPPAADKAIIFYYEGSASGFDHSVDNDVQLQIYHDGVWQETRTIPYDQISGGQHYPFSAETTRKVGLIAYAVPRGADESLIPAGSTGVTFDKQGVAMRAYGGTKPFYRPYTEDLFAGVLPEVKETLDIVNLLDVFCHVRVVIQGADLFDALFPGADPLLGLIGTTYSVTTADGAPDGRPVELRSAFTHDADRNEYATGTIMVLPSPDGQQTLSAQIFKNEDEYGLPAFETGEPAVAGKDIVVIYRMGDGGQNDNTVTITLKVNGWDLRTETLPIR